MNTKPTSNLITLNPHSVVDLITNSSTVIFTYQNSTEQCKELLAEIIKLMGEDGLTPDDMFYFGEFHEPDVYLDYIEDEDAEEEDETEELGEELDEDGVLKIIEKVMRGEMEAPKWLVKEYDSYDSYPPDQYLYLLPKDEKYAPLASKIKDFLNSPNHESSYN